MEVINMGNIYGFTGGSYAGIVFAGWGISPTINTAQGGNRMPMTIVAHSDGGRDKFDVRASENHH